MASPANLDVESGGPEAVAELAAAVQARGVGGIGFHGDDLEQDGATRAGEMLDGNFARLARLVPLPHGQDGETGRRRRIEVEGGEWDGRSPAQMARCLSHNMVKWIFLPDSGRRSGCPGWF